MSEALAEQQKTDDRQRVFAADRLELPEGIIRELMELDPIADPDWKKRLEANLRQLGENERKYAFHQYLEPKGIRYNAKLKQLEYEPPLTFEQAFNNTSSPELRDIGARLKQAQEDIDSAETPEAFADHLEGSLSLLDEFDTGDDLALQKQKKALRDAYLFRLVELTRRASFTVGRNYRGISAANVKRYTIEVFLKHQLLGYRFRTLPVTTLEEDPHPFIRDVVAPEARTRQCDIVRTATTIYLIAPTEGDHLNPFSVRRFLREEVTGDRFVHFNAAVIPAKHESLDKENVQKVVQFTLTRMVTLQRKLSGNIVAAVEELWKAQHDYLAPMLREPIDPGTSSLDHAITRRVMHFEKAVANEILREMDRLLREEASTPDDFDYLYMSLRRLLIELAGEVRDFGMDSAARWSRKTDELDLRVISMLRLLEKMRTHIFSVDAGADDAEGRKELEEFQSELNKLLKQAEDQELALRERLQEAQAREERSRRFYQHWMETMLRGFRKPETAEEVQERIRKNRFDCYIEAIRLQKRNRRYSVYLEFEELTPIKEGVRHYAIPRGRQGVSQLPAILRMSEDMETFSITAVKNALTLG
ncbi:hypothetical protein [Thioalkalivibrio sp. ALE23]|uniref:hypothetical protein n=1 Tax=Thioalkalivibrio sp. ALE23 TaxID=1265495 RepID=UPI00037DA0FA|nr:hypothetical protein [Thioalkalivibrio sp. ALE23]